MAIFKCVRCNLCYKVILPIIRNLIRNNYVTGVIGYDFNSILINIRYKLHTIS